MIFMRKKKVQFLRRCILCVLAIFTSFWTPSAYAEQAVLGTVITIVKQPDSRVDAYLGSSISGLLLEIEANVTSDASLYYQWYSNTVDSNVGGTVIDGATGDTLYLPFYNSVTDGSFDDYEEGHYEPAFDPGSYYYFCEVNADGAIPVRSNVTTFNVFPKPEGEIIITQQPSDITVTAGNITESLSIAYQQTLNADVYWFCNTTNSNQGGTRITYAPSDTFPIPRDLAPGTYYYYCLIQEPPGTPGGARLLVSDVAVVSVIPPFQYSYEIEKISVVNRIDMKENGTDSGELTVNVEVKRQKERNTTDNIIVATYNARGEMICLGNKQVNLGLEHKSTLMFHLPAQKRMVACIKAWMWDDLNTMNPLAEAKSLDLSLSFDNITLSSKHTLSDLLFSNSKK